MTWQNAPGLEWAVTLGLLVWMGTLYGFIRIFLTRRRHALGLLLAGLTQGLAALGILMILWNPSSRSVIPQSTQNRVLVVMDTSQSMSVQDTSQETRLDAAIDSFTAHAQTEADTAPQFDLLGLDSHLYRCRQLDQLKRWGSHSRLTPLIQRLRELPDSESGQEISGVVLFTDGQFEDASQGLGQRDWPDSFESVIIGVGSPEGLADIRLVDMRVPARVPLGSVCPIEVTVACSQKIQGPINLELLLDDLILETVTLEPKDWNFYQGQAQRTVTCQWPMAIPGQHILGARIASHPDDRIPGNNEAWTLIDVSEPPTYRVLLYSQRISMRVGKLRRVLESDPSVVLDLCLDVIKNNRLARHAGLPRQSVRFPNDLKPYDLIVMATSNASQWNLVLIDNLYDFVIHDGGGLILLTDKAEPDALAWEKNRLEQLLPVTGLDSSDSIALAKGKLIPTPEALDQGLLTNPFLQYLDLPAHAWYLGSPKPASTSLFEVEQTPAVLMHRVGQGHVCLVGLSKLFQLYREDRNGGALYELMNPLIRRLAPEPGQEPGLRVFAEKMPGQTDHLSITAWVKGQDHLPLEEADVLVTLDDQIVSLIPIGQGRYQTIVPYSGPQCFVVRAQAQAQGTYLGEAVTVTRLPSLRTEMSQTRLNEPLLKDLSQGLHGQYLRIQDVDHTVFDRFQGQRRTRPIEKVTSQWPRWPVWCGLLLLLCSGWTIRRSIGLG